MFLSKAAEIWSRGFWLFSARVFSLSCVLSGFCGSCLALWIRPLERGSWPLCFSLVCNMYGVPASVAQLDAPSDWRPGGHGFNPRRGRQHSFVEIDHEIFLRSFSPFTDSRRAVSGERMCTILVNRL